jgi:hypothetical protein
MLFPHLREFRSPARSRGSRPVQVFHVELQPQICLRNFLPADESDTVRLSIVDMLLAKSRVQGTRKKNQAQQKFSFRQGSARRTGHVSLVQTPHGPKGQFDNDTPYSTKFAAVK